jgi:hypothetical protein
LGHPEEINVGDLVTDTVIIPSDPASCWIGIVLQIIDKSDESLIDVKYLKNRDRIVVYWFHGSAKGRTEEVPDWFLKVLSKADDM